MTRQYIYTLIFALTFLTGNAEIINGPANIRIAPNEKILFSLNDSVWVDCTELKNDWFQVGITIKVTKDHYDQNTQIKKGEKLITLKGEIIGVALEDIPSDICSIWSSGGAKGNPAVYGMNIYAYTHKLNIRPASIPETVLADNIERNKNDLSYLNFKNFISTFEFRNEEFLKQTYPSLTEYMIYENAIDDPSPIDRIRLIFEKKELIAIIHSRELNIKSYTDIDLVRNLKMVIFKTPINIDRKTFIQKCIESYNGVD